MKKATSILQILAGAALAAAGVVGLIDACTRKCHRGRGLKL